MESAQPHWITTSIWGIADDELRDLYVRGRYRDVILPMTAIRGLDAVLEADFRNRLYWEDELLDEEGASQGDESLGDRDLEAISEEAAA